MYCFRSRVLDRGAKKERKMGRWTAGLLVHLYLVATASAGVQWDTVTFDTPTAEPGVNIGGLPIISGGMPIGNGERVCIDLREK